MRRCGIGLSILMLWMAVGLGTSRGQGTVPASGASTPNPPNAPATKRTARRSSAKPAGSTQGTGRESAPPSSSQADEAARRAKDQLLLDEQKRQSAAAAQITNREVERAQRQQDRVQKEVRIQDAPGPVQTGVVPTAGPPVVPANSDHRIQDAPGPAQTLPPPAPVQPSHPPDEAQIGNPTSNDVAD